MDTPTATERILGHSASGEPFLTLITPHYRRPRLFAANRASLEAQTDGDYEQVLLIDRVGLGWNVVQSRLADSARHARGRYVMGLDDDDRIADAGFIAALKREAEDEPEVIVTRCRILDNGAARVVPEDVWWKEPPHFGHISGQCLILRRDVWAQHAPAWNRTHPYDFGFIDDVFSAGHVVAWWDVIGAELMQLGKGQPEV